MDKLEKKVKKLERKLKESFSNNHTINRPTSSVKDIGFSETQNSGYRKEMEDGHCICDGFRGNPSEGFFGVYDGHGGQVAVDFVEENLHRNFAEGLKLCKTVRDAFVFSYKKTDYELKDYDVQHCGATSATCYLSENKGKKTRKLYTANCGDARAVLSRNGKAQRLTYDHKASDLNEQKRIQESYGIVMGNRVAGVLAVSRSFGDHQFKKWVCCDPFYSELELKQNDDLLIIACDGIWDVLEDQVAIDLIKDEQTTQKMADLLLKTALQRGSSDNISVMVIAL